MGRCGVGARRLPCLSREAVETLGPPGVLPSGEAVISLYGPPAPLEVQ